MSLEQQMLTTYLIKTILLDVHVNDVLLKLVTVHKIVAANLHMTDLVVCNSNQVSQSMSVMQGVPAR